MAGVKAVRGVFNHHKFAAFNRVMRACTRPFERHCRITGTVQLTCDRSLDEFDQPLDIREQLLVRFGDEAKELDDNVLQITPDTQSLPLAQHLTTTLAWPCP